MNRQTDTMQISDSIQLLDCTLRDGGRIIDCAFRNDQITGIIKRLMQAKIDIIEVGFLRTPCDYKGNSTFFAEIDQVKPLLPRCSPQQFSLFIDFGMYDVEKLPPADENYNLGIRYGFTRANLQQSKEKIKREMLSIKEKGYRLYFQGVNTVGYTDSELLELIALVNEVTPYSFGIVDTYGAMYPEDLDRIFSLVDFNLNSNIAIDFHGHNNIQMAFSLAQRAMKLCQGKRQLIIDATLDGMGKCAGNLNTELIVNYMNQKAGRDYGFDCLLDAIDEYVDEFKHSETWGYSIPAFMAGIYKAHPNNVIYLTSKFRLSTKDIRKILSMIEESKRQRYDYNNIQRIYKKYFATPFDDTEAIRKLRQEIGERGVLVLAAGTSIKTHAKEIEEYIMDKQPIVISVNYIHDASNFAFFGNDRRYQKLETIPDALPIILTSNIESRTGNEYVVSFMDCIAEQGNYFDNSTLMLLNLLRRIGVRKIRIAGMDGFISGATNYFNDTDLDKKCAEQYEEINRELEGHLRRFAAREPEQMDIKFITPSRYEHAIR